MDNLCITCDFMSIIRVNGVVYMFKTIDEGAELTLIIQKEHHKIVWRCMLCASFRSLVNRHNIASGY